MKIKSNMLRAASVCCSSSAARPALTGIHISSRYVESANGHVAIRMSHGVRVKNAVIIKLVGKVPVRAHETDLKLGKDLLAIHYDQFGLRVGISMVELINSTFPDFDKVIPTEPEDDLTPAFDINYLSFPSKMFGSRYFHGAKLQFFGYKKPALVTFSSRVKEAYGNPLFILMPMRQSEGDYIND